MNKPDILQLGAFAEGQAEMMAEHFTLHRYFEAKDKQKYVSERAEIISGIATRGDLGASGDLIRSLPNLEIIAVYGVGFDAVDLQAAKERNVSVSNTPDVLTGDVADLGVAMMLAASRGVTAADHWVRSGAWREGDYPLKSRVFGKRVGILGLGRIGREIARRCEAFSMPISYCDLTEYPEKTEWTYYKNPVEMASHSDFLFVAVTGGEATKHIVNQSVLEALGPNGMLINISRASNIDENSLLMALENGQLGFAALDVFENEPYLNPRFLSLTNVLLQPHHASGTVETRTEMARLMYKNLLAHFSGKPLLTPVVERR